MKTALVTGAGGRIGRAIAVELGRAGWRVGVHYRSSEDGASDTLAAIQDAGGDGWTVQADLATVAGCTDLVQDTLARTASLDLLVHNASRFPEVRFEDITLAHWDGMMALHARAPFLVSQGLLGCLRAASDARGGEGALVVHLLDIGAERPLNRHAAYSVSKAAWKMLMKAMAVELAPAIRSVGISPGQVMWPEEYDASTRDALSRRIPMKRVGSPADVAHLVRFLAEHGGYLNGVDLPVDGGRSSTY